MPIRAVIFDFGGVLMRTEDLTGRERWEAKHALPKWGLVKIVFESEVSARAMVGQVPEAEVWKYVGKVLGLSTAQLEELLRDFWSGDRLDARLVAFLRGLRPRYRTAILSNAWSDARAAFEGIYGLDQVVDEIIISAEEGAAKPDPRIYEIALERLGVRPEEALFVDDFPENIAGAQAVGMQAILFRDAAQIISDVQALLDTT